MRSGNKTRMRARSQPRDKRHENTDHGWELDLPHTDGNGLSTFCQPSANILPTTSQPSPDHGWELGLPHTNGNGLSTFCQPSANILPTISQPSPDHGWELGNCWTRPPNLFQAMIWRWSAGRRAQDMTTVQDVRARCPSYRGLGGLSSGLWKVYPPPGSAHSTLDTKCYGAGTQATPTAAMVVGLSIFQRRETQLRRAGKSSCSPEENQSLPRYRLDTRVLLPWVTAKFTGR
ncbi:hypothetical protein Bbelb_228740 [Branchiostoma belcheri]|nr:hypothetical protein Bbelb_228740 [Branchiostoma belcheri]